MKKYKFILKSLSYFLISLLIYLIIITTLSQFNFISYKVVSIFNFIFMGILFMISGYRLGKKSEKRGYLSGLFIGVVNVVLILVLSIILRSFPSFKNLIYFLVLLLSSTLGGMFGINKKNA